jgi:hypothetical protein
VLLGKDREASESFGFERSAIPAIGATKSDVGRRLGAVAPKKAAARRDVVDAHQLVIKELDRPQVRRDLVRGCG